MIRFILPLLALFLIGGYLYKKFKQATPKQRANFQKTVFYVLLCLLILYDLVTGRLTLLLVSLGTLMLALMARLLPVFINYIPYFLRLWQAKQQGQTFHQQERPDNNYAPTSGMTKAEAYQVLGLTPDATQQDVIAAHRRFMQKLHPDHGGSNYLAAKVNLAKEVLLAS